MCVREEHRQSSLSYSVIIVSPIVRRRTGPLSFGGLIPRSPEMMVLCPLDCHACDLTGCPSGGCALTGEPPLVACALCGTLVIRTAAFGVCAQCISVEEGT